MVIGLCPLLGLTKLFRVMFGRMNFLSSVNLSALELASLSISGTLVISGVGDLTSYTWSLSESECD